MNILSPFAARVAFAMLLTAGVNVASSAEKPAEVFPGASWQTRLPHELQFDSRQLRAFCDAVGGDGVVVRNGYLVQCWGEYDRHGDWASAAKPVLSTLLLFAVQEGLVAGVDEAVRPWVQRRWPGKDLIEKDRSITFRHLADMTSGYARGEPPGSHWAYNDYAISLYQNLLSEIFHAPLNDVAVDRLKALQFEDGDIFGSRDGAGVKASPRDFARIGWFWLHEGRWAGTPLLPARLFQASHRPDVPRNLPRTRNAGTDYLQIGSYGGGSDQNFPGQGVYGFNWWFNHKMADRDERFFRFLPADAFAAIGHRGNEVLLVVPSRRLVVAARGDWGGVRLEKTELLNAAIRSERPVGFVPTEKD